MGLFSSSSDSKTYVYQYDERFNASGENVLAHSGDNSPFFLGDQNTQSIGGALNIRPKYGSTANVNNASLTGGAGSFLANVSGDGRIQVGGVTVKNYDQELLDSIHGSLGRTQNLMESISSNIFASANNVFEGMKDAGETAAKNADNQAFDASELLIYLAVIGGLLFVVKK